MSLLGAGTTAIDGDETGAWTGHLEDPSGQRSEAEAVGPGRPLLRTHSRVSLGRHTSPGNIHRACRGGEMVDTLL
jgi:hypothetical protein